MQLLKSVFCMLIRPVLEDEYKGVDRPVIKNLSLF